MQVEGANRGIVLQHMQKPRIKLIYKEAKDTVQQYQKKQPETQAAAERKLSRAVTPPVAERRPDEPEDETTPGNAALFIDEGAEAPFAEDGDSNTPADVQAEQHEAPFIEDRALNIPADIQTEQHEAPLTEDNGPDIPDGIQPEQDDETSSMPETAGDIEAQAITGNPEPVTPTAERKPSRTSTAEDHELFQLAEAEHNPTAGSSTAAM